MIDEWFGLGILQVICNMDVDPTLLLVAASRCSACGGGELVSIARSRMVPVLLRAMIASIETKER